MPGSGNRTSPFTVANALTTLRLCSAPVLLWLAWQEQRTLFVVVLIASFVTDLIDGPAARWLNQASDLGSRYDSVADASVYLALPICVYWLRPEFVREEAVYLVMVLVCYVAPLAVSLARFGRVPSLHTISSKCAAVALGVAIVLVFLDWTDLPFQIGAVLYVLVAVEELAILWVLPEWRADVPTLRHALAYRRDSLAEQSGAPE
jgi:CDP-diacylglycerol--glycerol-3-phosphate 3-phosphatidyltransferase